MLALIQSSKGGNAPNYWIGFNNRDASSGWKWTDSSPSNFFNWAPGEHKFCLQMSHAGHHCNNYLMYAPVSSEHTKYNENVMYVCKQFSL